MPQSDSKNSNIRLLVGAVFVILLLFGPIDHSWPFWFAIRIAYLISIPAAVTLLLAWIWRRWQPDQATEKRLTCVIAGAVAGALFVGAALELQADHHFECDQEIQTRDGTECVGDIVRVPGPDRGDALLMLGFGAFAAWLGITDQDAEPTANDATDSEL